VPTGLFDQGNSIMRKGVIVFAALLAMAPLGARSADLVVWWEKGYYAQEDDAVREIIAAFEQDSGKQVELVLGQQEELVANLVTALEAGRPTPDFLYTVVDIPQTERWAYEGRLVDLSDAVGHFSDLFERDALERSTLLDGSTGRRAAVASTCYL
jgi:multiple sugar transport system substrate-binding protein